MPCPICSGSTEHFGSALVRGQYEGHFRRCLSCCFLFAENPVWLDDAYSSAITATDLGLVDRNLWFAKISRSVVSLLFNADGKFLDYGGGTGLFTRLMRDAGYDWYCCDPNCRNIFAEGFSADISNRIQYELITAAEVFEHLAAPVQTFLQLKELSANILFSTCLLPDPPPSLETWWYYGLEHGQHISFYSRKSLQVLADSAGLNLASNGKNLHLFSRKKVSEQYFSIVTNSVVCGGVSLLNRRISLLPSDYKKSRDMQRFVDASRP
jgi:hypothetical protein